MVAPTDEPLDPRRWFAASVAIVSVAIPVLDNTVLNLAVPTILREFHTQLSSLQWVITGYSLTFATLLIIGGRLGDIFGHRRMFVIGASIFGVGSFLASISTSVPTLFVGEALIEGIGASMMIPATLSILSTTFKGAERPKAFAAWGAVAGASVAFGPIVGGFLTTDYSWRWALPDQRDHRADHRDRRAGVHAPRRAGKRDRPRIDVRGAALIARGIVQLDLRAERRHHLRLVERRSRTSPSGTGTCGRRRGRSRSSRSRSSSPSSHSPCSSSSSDRWNAPNRDPLFEFGQLRHLGFRYGLLTTMVLAMGQFGLLVHPSRAPAERRTSLRAARRRVDAAAGCPHRARGARRRTADPSLQRHEHRAHRPRARVDRAALGRARDLAARLVPRAAAGDDRVRPRRRLRELAADQRDPLGHRPGEGGRRQRRQHDRPPGRARARHRDVRVVHRRRDAYRADPRPRSRTARGRRCCSRPRSSRSAPACRSSSRA